jgi:hypothetical protein
VKLVILVCSIFFADLVSVEQYFCTAINDRFFYPLLNLIGSIHRYNYEDLKEIAVFDLGISWEHRQELEKISKVSLYTIKEDNSWMLHNFDCKGGSFFGWYAWKPIVIKESLEKFPYVLWLDSACMVQHSFNQIFEYIKEKGYFLLKIGDKSNINWGTTTYVKDQFDLNSLENAWILEQEFLLAGVIGVSRKPESSFIYDWYALTKDIKNFQDDGTASGGWGACRHDQTLLSILAYSKKLTIFENDPFQQIPINISCTPKESLVPFYVTWDERLFCEKTCILYHSDKFQCFCNSNFQFIRSR